MNELNGIYRENKLFDKELNFAIKICMAEELCKKRCIAENFNFDSWSLFEESVSYNEKEKIIIMKFYNNDREEYLNFHVDCKEKYAIPYISIKDKEYPQNTIREAVYRDTEFEEELKLCLERIIAENFNFDGWDLFEIPYKNEEVIVMCFYNKKTKERLDFDVYYKKKYVVPYTIIDDMSVLCSYPRNTIREAIYFE
ncbi:TPA: hypothetical protein KRD64_002243 [Clostridioides difficile]|uniref:hypothetical protein n=1 Tax=Clostridioides difficile TaxID=1496 RepID=UPI000C9A0106|nr:hypothetical protein [Clostridioides difficile]EGT3953433.1 hypothetical protein [Clostridioides difficile]HBG7379674.1 hypothetical protein [Clostridioides difficile]